MSPVMRYRTIALTALVGAFISAYLLLYSLGYYGFILCGTGACEVVQSSKYAVFLGIPVPGWGLAWYGGMLVLALVAAARGEGTRGPGLLLALGATAGVAFTIYLTVIEAFVLRAWCRWCVVSAALSVLIFLLAAPWRRLKRESAAG